ncbi:PAS domain-containing sensor histidine kinase [Chromatocurvus halotolerans]|uniref:histidine kinase n=1 Tax=Chromatocurvus halotolerans TaxID=1132028 RepID=A0A4R2KYH9_9GAMM|nr:ATP-binding protein [Chromatocurvus halotolerans]TCO71755.1 PAS domain S-box-containing protein [Chromatocurvus halotolerans]
MTGLQQAQLLFMRHPDPMWIYALDSLRFLLVNDAAVRIYGYSHDEFQRMTLRDIRPAADIPLLEANVRGVTQGLDEAGFWLHRRSDGELITVDITSEVIEYEGIRAELVLARNVTPLVDARREVAVLREAISLRVEGSAACGVDAGTFEDAQQLQQRLHRTLENMKDAFVTLNRQFVVTYANSAFARLVGSTVSGVMGRHAWSCFPGTADTAFGVAFKKALYAGERAAFTEYHPDTGAWLCVTSYPVPEGFAVYVQDVTERRELAQRMEQAEKLEAIGQLTGGIAHDFNNLLTVIIGNTDLLAEALADDPLRAMVDMTSAAAVRASDLVDSLLAFSRRQTLQPAALDINARIRALQPLLQRVLAANIDLSFDLAGNLAQTFVDAAKLDSALLNLAINARDAMPDGGQLRITTGNCVLDGSQIPDEPSVSAGAYVFLSVADTGCGMPQEDLGRAFEPFFTTKPVGKGTGLGLSMVHGFVRQSGGHVNLASTQGAGTVVTLYLPQIRAETASNS